MFVDNFNNALAEITDFTVFAFGEDTQGSCNDPDAIMLARVCGAIGVSGTSRSSSGHPELKEMLKIKQRESSVGSRCFIFNISRSQNAELIVG